MSRFITKLRTESLSPDDLAALKSDRQLYRLTDDFTVQSDYLGAIFNVPRGYVSDFASIPRGAWPIIAPNDPVIEYPSVVHDFLYTNHGELPGLSYDRKDSDHVLDELMLLAGAGAIVRKLVFLNVRAFGGSHWNPQPKKP